jgi:site-specific recombinase XerD
MDPGWMELDAAAKKHKISAAGLRRDLNAKKPGLVGRKVPWGQREKWEVYEPSLIAYLNRSQQEDRYTALVQTWKEDQRSGRHTTKDLKEDTIERNYYGIKAFWAALGVKESLDAITLQNIATSIYNVGKEHPSVRENIYMGTRSFYKLLVRENLRSEADLHEFKKFKPPRNKRPRRTVIKDERLFYLLVETNQWWTKGRSRHDKLITHTLLMLAWHTGLRNKEMCNLLLEHLDLDRCILTVFKGKGDKDRKVGISSELKAVLKAYLEKRKNTTYQNLLVSNDGTPLNRHAVAKRIRTLLKEVPNYCKDKELSQVSIDITPHGLRRSLITRLLLGGVAPSKVQKIAGHSKLETTQLYDMSDDEDSLDVLRELEPAPKSNVEIVKDPPKETKKARLRRHTF